jgi:hypothetical protein
MTEKHLAPAWASPLKPRLAVTAPVSGSTATTPS